MLIPLQAPVHLLYLSVPPSLPRRMHSPVIQTLVVSFHLGVVLSSLLGRLASARRRGTLGRCGVRVLSTDSLPGVARQAIDSASIGWSSIDAFSPRNGHTTTLVLVPGPQRAFHGASGC